MFALVEGLRVCGFGGVRLFCWLGYLCSDCWLVFIWLCLYGFVFGVFSLFVLV